MSVYRAIGPLVCIFEKKSFCFPVAMSDLVHNVEAIYGLC